MLKFWQNTWPTRVKKLLAAEWTKFKKQSYLTRLQLEGFDRMGIVNQVTNIISKENNINMRSVKFETNEGIFKGDFFCTSIILKI